MAEYAEIEKWAMSKRDKLKGWMFKNGCRSEDDFDDLFQECLIQAFKSKTVETYKTWFSTVMKRKWINVVRARRKRPIETELFECRVGSEPEWGAVGSEVQSVLRALTEPELDTIQAKYTGLTGKEAAVALETTPRQHYRNLENIRRRVAYLKTGTKD